MFFSYFFVNICILSPTEKMINSEVLEGVPLLVLANKQDVPVLYDVFNSLTPCPG